MLLSGFRCLRNNSCCGIISPMDYRFFVIEPGDYEKYPEIPEEYADLEERHSIIMGAAEDDPEGDEENLLGLMICSVSVTDEKAGRTTYVWCRRQAIAGELFSAMTSEYIKALSERNIKTVFFHLIETDEKAVSFFMGDKSITEGCTEAGTGGYCKVYYVEDFYDTLFMRTQVIKASQNEHLMSFSDCTSEECRQYLESLLTGEEDKYLFPVIYNSGSFFYMEKGKPEGVIMIDHYRKNSVMISGACIKNKSAYAKILRSLLAGVLSGSLDGIGPNGQLLVKLKDPNAIRVLEECLGENDGNVMLKEYRYDIK